MSGNDTQETDTQGLNGTKMAEHSARTLVRLQKVEEEQSIIDGWVILGSGHWSFCIGHRS